MTDVYNAANYTKKELQRVELPKIDKFTPENLKAVAAAFALAARKFHAAEDKIKRIKTEKIERDKKLDELQKLLNKLENTIIDIWCCTYSDALNIGDTVLTVEVPGHFLEEPAVSKSATLYPMTPNQRVVFYTERSINLAPQGVNLPASGQLRPAEAMTAAAVYYNLAMEPGHEHWKPLWRYGILTSSSNHIHDTSQSDVTLNECYARRERGGALLKIDTEMELQGVPIVYPPCHGAVFDHDDEVLILFEGMDRTKPKIIGFRREPRQCPPTWNQLI
mgnify:CR=1 FL=1